APNQIGVAVACEIFSGGVLRRHETMTDARAVEVVARDLPAVIDAGDVGPAPGAASGVRIIDRGEDAIAVDEAVRGFAGVGRDEIHSDDLAEVVDTVGLSPVIVGREGNVELRKSPAVVKEAVKTTAADIVAGGLTAVVDPPQNRLHGARGNHRGVSPGVVDKSVGGAGRIVVAADILTVFADPENGGTIGAQRIGVAVEASVVEKAVGQIVLAQVTDDV